MIEKSLVSKAIRLDLPADKSKAFAIAVKSLCEHVAVAEGDALKAVMDREKIMPTAIGLGVALPHAKMKGLKKFSYTICRAKDALDCEGPDKAPIKIIVLLLSPEDKMKEHITLMAEITRRLKFNHVRQAMLEAKTSKALENAFLRDV